MNKRPVLFEAAEQWYYSRGKRAGVDVTGPFNTLQEASEALSFELERQHGTTSQDHGVKSTTKEKS